MKMKKLLSLLCVAAMIFALAACGGSQAPAAAQAPAAEAPAAEAPAEEAQVFNVGICQLVQHPALDAATQGFKDALTEKLGDAVSFNEQNASGDAATCSVICNQFVSDEVDLIMANATASLQAAASATNVIPILGTSITDYGTALGIEGFTGVSGTNISGTSDLAPLDGQAQMLSDLFPDAKTVGLVYCSGEPNSKFQVETIAPMLTELGYTVTEYTFADSNDVANVTASACAECDVLYIPTDNTAASCTEAINNVALVEKTPIVVGEEGICKGCGVATLSISYYDIGYETGLMAAEILTEGADISTMEVRYAPQFTKEYNVSICETLGITVPEDYVAIPET
ncbi:MAG: ABC transporter substrate-binding protein [Oscillospiraceae bacterium]|nr:ABC transporter substrate-binding protein [Oscillospiraceae bacterium]